MRIVRMDAADFGCRQDDRLGVLTFEKTTNRQLIRQVEFRVGTQKQIPVTLVSQGAHHGRTHQTAMSGDVNPRRLADLHDAIRDGYKPYSPLWRPWHPAWPPRGPMPPSPPPTPKNRPPPSSQAFAEPWWHRPREYPPPWGENSADRPERAADHCRCRCPLHRRPPPARRSSCRAASRQRSRNR